MPWDELRLSLQSDRVPGAEDALETAGALAVTLLDTADEPVLEPAPGQTPLWPVVELRALFDAGTDRGRVLDALSGLPGIPRPDAANWRRVEDRDWERAWMDRFRPMRFGRRLWVVPTGMEAPGGEAACVLRLDPGLAFGSGTHPTTALCLEWLDAADCRGCIVVDYGCGSGILGVAAALSGAERVICVDNDPQALAATAGNATRNGVAERLTCLPPDAFEARDADIVLANILAAPLIELAPRLGGSLRPGGRIVLSGILCAQADCVAQAYRPFVGTMSGCEREGWVRLEGSVSGRDRRHG